jgi:hypothetical protein
MAVASVVPIAAVILATANEDPKTEGEILWD